MSDLSGLHFRVLRCFSFPGKACESTLPLFGGKMGGGPIKETWQGEKGPWVQIPSPSLAGCVTLNTSLSLSEPRFPHLQPPRFGKMIRRGD